MMDDEGIMIPISIFDKREFKRNDTEESTGFQKNICTFALTKVQSYAISYTKISVQAKEAQVERQHCLWYSRLGYTLFVAAFWIQHVSWK